MDGPNQNEEAVFDNAARLASAERLAYLDDACAGQPELRSRVEELLAALERAPALMQEPAVGRQESSAIQSAAMTGQKLGHYKLLEQIGEGGCGVVFVAEQEEPVRRRVALKIIK